MKLEMLEQKGMLRLILAIDKKERYITEVIKRKSNPQGFVSQDSLRVCRQFLQKLGLAEEITEEGPRAKIYLRITPKGRRVAEKIKEIAEILEKETL